MAARVVFVFLYGGFVEGTQRHLRPSAIYFFTADQARQTTDVARLDWLKTAFKPGFRPPGKRWYADTSREPIRDDLIRARLVRMGLVGRKAAVATTSSSPIYFLRSAFARLFDSTLKADELESAIETWRSHHLAPATLQRMAIKATGILAAQGDLVIDMPDGARMRMTAGPSSNILKALIESYAPRWLDRPAVLWISVSDRQTHPYFVELAASAGLRFDPQELLPDLILADLGERLRIVFCEIVASDGPVDEARKAALLDITRRSGIGDADVRFVTAYLDRESASLRKTFHRIAPGSELWFSNEPDLIVRFEVAPGRA